MIVSPVWGTPTPENVEKLPKIPVISVTAPSGEKLKEQAQQGSSCTLSTSVDTGIRKIPTLTVDIQSDQEEDSFILFSGHVDSWHYGAMDNGTANATMLEVARVLAKNKHLLKRNVRLAFWSGHSHGRYAGSALYCDTHWQELYDHCVAHVNIDSVGGNGATVLSQGNCMAETKNIAQKAVYEVTEQDFEGKRYGKAGDQSFWGTGVPSLFMGLSEQPPLDGTAANAHQELFGQSGKSSGFGWWWHTTEDTTDKINPEFLLRDCQVYLLSILELACKDLLPINHIAALEDIKNGLQEWEGKLQGEMTLEELQQRVDSLIQRVESINILKNEPLTEAQLQTFNHLTMKLSRYFVPFNYVADNPFQFDTLFQLPRVPALLDIDALQKVSPQDEAAFFIKTKIRRKINELSFQLNQANQEINRFYETLKKE
nr:M28 family peptidase [Texcoconibacillus texcoconensis]